MVGKRHRRRQQPLIEEREIVRGNRDVLDVLDQPVVLGVEHEVDGREADILVAAAVAGDEVGVEQFVVVGAGLRRAARRCTVVGASGVLQHATVESNGQRAVRDVVEEGVAGAQGINRHQCSEATVGVGFASTRRRCAPGRRTARSRSGQV